MNNNQVPGQKVASLKEDKSKIILERICIYCEGSIKNEFCPDCNMHQEKVWQGGAPLNDDFHRYGHSPLNDPEYFGLEIIADHIINYPFPGDHCYELIVVWQNPKTGELRAASDYGHQAPDIFAALTWEDMRPIKDIKDLKPLVERDDLKSRAERKFYDGLFQKEELADFKDLVKEALGQGADRVSDFDVSRGDGDE